MISKVAYFTLMVRDQDEALAFYTGKLGFEKRADQAGDGFRWLVVGPAGQPDIGLVLMKGQTAEEAKVVGNQTGGRVPLMVLTTEDLQEAYQGLLAKGVDFVTAPMDNPWGMAAQLTDLYGNKFDLLQLRRMP